MGYRGTGWLQIGQGIDLSRERWIWVLAHEVVYVAAWRGLTREKVREILRG